MGTRGNVAFMLTQKLQVGLGAFVIMVAVGAPTAAQAHTYVMQPPPRDIANTNLDARAHKTGPCGGVPRTGKPTAYATGADIEVKFQETIGHAGCFQIAFSPANDQNFVTLGQYVDKAGDPDNTIYTKTVKLPAGVTCKECTLVVRQLMLENATNKTCALPEAVPPTAGGAAGSTYFSCADICVGPDCVDGGAMPVDPQDGGSTEPGTDSGVSTQPTDGGGKLVDAGDDDDDGARPNLRSGDGGGCSVALGATSGATLGISAGLLGLALLRRRRAKK